MQSIDELCRRGSEIRRRRAMRVSGQGMVTLMIAGFLAPAPGNVAAITIATVGLGLIALQRTAARRLASA